MIQWLWYVLLRLPVAFAASNNSGGAVSITFPNPLGACTSGPAALCVLNKLIDVVFTFAIPVTAIMVLVSGYQMVTAAGDPEKFGKGRKTLQYAAIGFGVVILAKSVVPFIQSIFP